MAPLKACLHPDRRAGFVEQSMSDVDTIMARYAGRSAYDTLDELYLRQRMVQYLQPKVRLLARHGLHVRDPWLDPDLLDFVRALPTRYRIRKRLLVRALYGVDPELARIPLARANENVSYQPFLRTAQVEGRGVTELILDQNPLFAEYFDTERVRSLIGNVCSPQGSTRGWRRWTVRTRLPVPVQLWAYSVKHYFGNPVPRLSGTALLLRIATVACALRGLATEACDRSAKSAV